MRDVQAAGSAGASRRRLQSVTVLRECDALRCGLGGGGGGGGCVVVGVWEGEGGGGVGGVGVGWGLLVLCWCGWGCWWGGAVGCGRSAVLAYARAHAVAACVL